MNKIQEVMEFRGSEIPKDILKAVIEEIEKLQKENYSAQPADEEERIDEQWYNAGLQKIKQLLEDSIK